MNDAKTFVTIIHVLNILKLPYNYNGIGGSFNMDCPFCHKKKHLNINVEKDVWNCAKCGESGGMIALYRKFDLTVCDNKEAYRKICKLIEENEYMLTPTLCNSEQHYKVVSKIASIQDRDKTYTNLLSYLDLDDSDLNALLKRGLSKKAIRRLGYKSTPHRHFDFETAQKLIECGCNLDGVAGFVKYKGKWCFFPNADGILIPFRNIEGQISALQIRSRDCINSKKRYMCLSTEKICENDIRFTQGSRAKLCTHVVGYKKQNTVFLTEGALKGDVACYLSSKLFSNARAFICVAGVNNTGDLKELFNRLKKDGVVRIIGAFDMDKSPDIPQYNENVRKALIKVKRIIKELGLLYSECLWNANIDGMFIKGVDDNYKMIYDLQQLFNKTAA